MTPFRFDNVRFGPDGLIPVVVQDAVSRDVLMLAYMNDEALRLTQETSRAHYWSRSRSRLWRKGESSGHEQIVEDVFINCEQNSLLLLVHQTGAVCHDGYDTCYYRSLNEDGSLTTVRGQVFDPATIYGSGAATETAIRNLAEATQRQFGAYVYLRDHDFEHVSATSRRLRQPDDHPRSRIADELRELAAVLDGTHAHADFHSDVNLEASQVMYWVLLVVIQQGTAWSELRPDRALATTDDALTTATISRLLSREAAAWESEPQAGVDWSASAHAVLALVGQACRVSGVDPLDIVLADLTALMKRPYLEPYFAGHDG